MLTIKNVRKEYRTGHLIQKALDGVTLTFRDREFVAILGPSGSGKTTLLNIIGGLDRCDSGEMMHDSVSTGKYGERDWDTYRNHTIGFIFQNYHLIPHQTILSNVELAMTLAGVDPATRRERAQNALERVGLLDQAAKKPMQLSGGQMQRVAIARALVNNPSILLADEPTGALDSDTGEQVMQLLGEVAKDHLVIMVTHNPDLAQRYASRIIRLRDGRITEDTNPFLPDAAAAPGTTNADVYAEAAGDSFRTAQEQTASSPEAVPQRKKSAKMRHSSMSFLTALSLSVSNLLSKKTRTILVAFAASIGIVGIALILSLSNGANAYIRQMERDSLSQYPIEILSSAFSMEETMMAFASMRSSMGEAGSSSAQAEGSAQIQEQQMMGGMLSSAKINDLTALKRWFDSGISGIEEYTRGVDYRYGISPLIYLEKGDGYRQVNPDQTLSAIGVTMDDSLTGSMSSYGLNEIFRALPENPALYENDYTLIAGTWPQKDTDCVVVLSSSGTIPDVMLYTMGLKDIDALNNQLENLVEGTGSNAQMKEDGVYDPEDFIGICFSLLPAYEKYSYDEKLRLWIDHSGNEKELNKLLDQAEQMRIVGVVQPSDEVTFGILELGIEYPGSLLKRLMNQAEESDPVKAQLASPSIDILTGIPFGESDLENTLPLSEMLEIHPENLAGAINIDWNGLEKLETDETRLTTQRLVRIIRELSRTGKSETLDELIKACFPLLMDLIEIDEKQMEKVISLAMDEERLAELLTARTASAATTLENNLRQFGYANPSEPTSISIYPVDFESKEEVLRILDAYNAAMEAEGHEDKVISYTDYVGALMTSVTTIIDVITYVLIAFVAVSLVVSSIMIGIITYISVLERQKEIGILRAMGASRWNITEVFNAETFIIGALAGAFGIALTLLLQIPINRLIRSYAHQDSIRAFLPPRSGLILVGLCILLTFIGGFIPSRRAARQDPVKALRSGD